MHSFLTSQFNCCPLIWMLGRRGLNNKISLLHERCLRVVYNDSRLSFEVLLDKDKKVSIHVKKSSDTRFRGVQSSEKLVCAFSK